MDIDLLAEVGITSEDANYPIESALIPGTGLGWAAEPGDFAPVYGHVKGDH
jgi:hypothetical protein